MKKIITAIIIVALATGFFFVYQQYEKEQAVNVGQGDYQRYQTLSSEGYISYKAAPRDVDDGVTFWKYAFIKPIIEKTNCSYTALRGTFKGWDSDIITEGMSRESFIKELKEKSPAWWSAGFELEDAEKWIKEIVANMMIGGSTHCKYEFPDDMAQQKHSSTTVISAFKKSKDFVGIMNPSMIGDAGLELKITNPTIQRIIAFIQKPIEADGCFIWNVEVDADVKTKEKPDCVKDDWIPEKNKKAKVTFIFTMALYDTNPTMFRVSDIAVKGYN